MEKRETELQRNSRLAVKIYDHLYRERFGNKPFMAPASIRDMINFGKGKWMVSFRSVVKCIFSLRDERGGADTNLKQYLTDYFTLVLDYYERFKRRPTLKQITGKTAEDRFRVYVYDQEEEWGAYFCSQKTLDRMAFHRKYSFNNLTYDPILPHLWDGPGDPSKIPELNNQHPPLPIKLDFRKMIKYRLIDPPQEDIDEYNRLFVEDPDDNRWVGDGNPEPVEKPGVPERVSQEPKKPRNKYGITKGPITIGRVPRKAPERVPVKSAEPVSGRTPARVERRVVPARAKPAPQRVNSSTPKRVERARGV
jgi:hypothetical protein